MSAAVPEALEFGKAIVWGKGSLGMRPSEGMQRQLENLSVAPLKPTPLNTLTDQRITDMTFSLTGGAAVTEGGKLWTWGTNKHVLGLGGKVVSVPVPRPVKALADTNVVQVALGDKHGAAIGEGGFLFTWGYGGFPFWRQGALGHGDRVDQPQPAVVEAFLEEDSDEPKTRVVQVGCGAEHMAALDDEGNVWAWGEGESGLLGSGMFAASLPRLVDFEEEGIKCSRIAVGAGFTLALDVDGRVWCWGRNGHGQLGLGEDAAVDIQSSESIPSVVPHFPADEEAIVDIAAGGRCSIALGKSGRVYCWGDRIHMRPFHVSHFTDNALLNEGEIIVRVAAGHGAFGVLTSEGRIFTFGNGSFSGATGQGVTSGAMTPAILSGLGENSAAQLILAGKSGAMITGSPPSAVRAPLVPFSARS
ncbi:hypothetical protein FNF27_00961 [Cafeteria roenbergensis]|nr:hypothetical protein FNF31_00401 [Cafeteria roenbergensis]KAA0171195.1 hypothetical protein FNF28_00961 [Cafeteria roenbergensis]KAA0177790.1 hypothetical protein FNF27_00961 [Cafeteria roenbergensis]